MNLTRLPPVCTSSQRHWHTHEDELIYVLDGELVLVTDAGVQVLTPGMTAGFRAGVADAHMLVNRTARDALYLEIAIARRRTRSTIRSATWRSGSSMACSGE